MPDAVRVWTREDVLALPDDRKRYELIDGALLVSPAPSWVHQYAVMRLYDRVHPYVTAQRVGTTILSPADLDLKSGQLVPDDAYRLARVVDASKSGLRPAPVGAMWLHLRGDLYLVGADGYVIEAVYARPG